MQGPSEHARLAELLGDPLCTQLGADEHHGPPVAARDLRGHRCFSLGWNVHVVLHRVTLAWPVSTSWVTGSVR